MAIRTRKEAVSASLNQTTNKVGMCQQVTRLWFNAPSVGDHDGDGAADAEDGWKAEPERGRHAGDRKPPAGVPVSWSGGRSDNGHRAISLGPTGPNGQYMIRSTDAPGAGTTGTVPLDYPEKKWGLNYLGWSETINGHKIPEDKPKPKKKPAPKPAPKPDSKTLPPTKVSEAYEMLEEALANAVKAGNKPRAGRLRAGLALLPKR